jgi:hypothetical protein
VNVSDGTRDHDNLIGKGINLRKWPLEVDIMSYDSQFNIKRSVDLSKPSNKMRSVKPLRYLHNATFRFTRRISGIETGRLGFQAMIHTEYLQY